MKLMFHWRLNEKEAIDTIKLFGKLFGKLWNFFWENQLLLNERMKISEKFFFLREIEMGSDHIHLILKNGLATSNLKPTTFLKVNPLQVQLLTLSNFPEQLFYRTPQDHCFWCILKVKVTGSLSLRTHKK